MLINMHVMKEFKLGSSNLFLYVASSIYTICLCPYTIIYPSMHFDQHLSSNCPLTVTYQIFAPQKRMILAHQPSKINSNKIPESTPMS